MFLVYQGAHNGAYERNPNYFQHNGITDVVVDVNGCCISNIKSSFPRECAQAYHQTLSALGMCDSSHLITRQNFAAERTIFVMDTRPTETEGVINQEKNSIYANYSYSLIVDSKTDLDLQKYDISTQTGLYYGLGFAKCMIYSLILQSKTDLALHCEAVGEVRTWSRE